MILYNGTTLEKARRILASGVIKAEIERDFSDNEYFSGTTNGYVYLTQALHTAYFYGNIKVIDCECAEKYVCIFKIDTQMDQLVADFDELRDVMRMEVPDDLSADESLWLCGCARTTSDVNVEGGEYIIIPATINRDFDGADRTACLNLSALQTNARCNSAEDVYTEIFARWAWQDASEILL